MGNVIDESCPLCDIRESDVVTAAGPCVAIWSNEPPQGSAMLIPRAHRQTPWELTAQEWTATSELLRMMMERITTTHGPDGWNVGWNVGRVGGQSVEHVHCHVVPRYRGERHAGKGLRWPFKQPENAPDVTSS